jgi:uncharacterized membrane protein HdeD (DUF308 family)
MADQRFQLRPRTEFLIGLLIALTGVLTTAVGIAADVRGIWVAGVVVLVLGVLAMIGMLLPRRKDGTRIWQTDQGKAV